jgi:DNA-directed RNA polymerase subunit beta'
MILGLYYLTYCRSLDVRPVGDEGNGRPMELVDLVDPVTREWKLPEGTEARFQGSEWSTNPFEAAGYGEVRAFRGAPGVVAALEAGALGLQDVIEFRDPQTGERSNTTAGRVVFNHEIKETLQAVVGDEEMRDKPFPESHRTFNKRETGDFIERLVNLYGPSAISQVLDAFKTLGFRHASMSGITISKNDIVIPPTKPEIIARYEDEVEAVEEYFGRGEMSAEERHEEVVKLWERATDEVAAAMEAHLFRLNPIFMMANSGARGSFKQIRQLAGMRGLMNNPKGETMERPIKSNFMEGLSVLEYFISTHGARKGLADTALKTADSGYLTRRLVDVSQDVIVREHDCGTTEGIDTPVYRDGRISPNLLGRVLLGPVVDRSTGEVIVDLRPDETDEPDPEGTDPAERGRRLLITTEDVERVDVECRTEDGAMRPAWVRVRSPLKCRSEVGICAQCYGRNPASGKLCEPGDAVGIIAAQSIGEPGTQLTMRTFHTGGVSGADITHGLPRVVELFEARKPKALALVAETDGWIRIDDDESRPGAAHLIVIEPEYIAVEDIGTGAVRQPVREHAHNVPKRTQIIVRDGQWVEAGDLLTIGSAFPSDILGATAGFTLGVTGTIAAVTPEGKGWLKVDVTTEAGVSTRYLRLPEDRPRPGFEPKQKVQHDERFFLEDRRPDRSTKTELYLVKEVQNVYRSQGVDINDKHIELIVRQMLRKVRIEDNGETNFLPGQLVDKPVLYRQNALAALRRRDELLEQRESGEWTGSDGDLDRELDEVQATFEPLILGITKASLATESLLSAASFQETTKVLTDAALEGKSDHLRGLKENVIIGKLIPAATGLKRYRTIDIGPADAAAVGAITRPATEEQLLAALEEIGSDGGDLDLGALGIDFGGEPTLSHDEPPEGPGGLASTEAEEIPEIDSPE